MSGTEMLTYMISILVGGIKGIGEGIAQGIAAIVQALFLTGTGESAAFSIFGNFVLIFAAIALGFSLTRWVLNFLTSFGQRNS